MSDFEAIISASYTDQEVTDTVSLVRDAVARDLEITVMHDNCRGYL